ncbi:MAG: gamma carbonic anhydrase family protein [Betaproteobacteria bacterium RIFCSPLOWO2_02_67_12]|nr:MAG: gamma carbonic anhydrase family protein [Betaproteobacteria bacterium RIFCSPLOWO2_02_67_12]OGA64101.1 MAG: gamma carbonic anhydrase family protein [Betaproteobacteria bacterium RIFCSPLOWO2_12_FULL_67_28]
MAVYQLGDKTPRIAPSAYVANEATVIGDVTLGERASVWPGVVIRGDNEPIRIGEAANIQDGAVLHADPGCPLSIGNGVSVGHQAMLHGCTIGDHTLVGIQAVIMNKAQIGKDCIVGAGSVVPEGKVFPDRSLVLGVPAKVVRQLTDQDLATLRSNAESYTRRQEIFKKQLKRIG